MKSKRIKTIINKINYSLDIYKRSKRLIKRAKVNTNSNVLTSEQEKKAKDYFLPYKKINLSFHRFYTEKTGIFDEKYIPEDLYYYYIDRFYNNVHEADFMDNKCYYPLIFKNINMPVVIARRMNGIWFGDDDIILTNAELEEALSHEKSLFIKKATLSYGGKGVRYIEDPSSELFWKTIEDIKGDIVVQRPVTQHKSMARVNSSSVNTIRVLSLLNRDGSVIVFSTILRMGIAGSKVDNASSGGLTCGIDSNGQCHSPGYYSYVGGGKRVDSHPTSGISFNDIVIPNFDGVISLIKKAHLCVPHFRLVSWDVAINEESEPVLIEANLCNGEVDFHQLNNGPLFGEYTRQVLEEVFEGK